MTSQAVIAAEKTRGVKGGLQTAARPNAIPCLLIAVHATVSPPAALPS